MNQLLDDSLLDVIVYTNIPTARKRPSVRFSVSRAPDGIFSLDEPITLKIPTIPTQRLLCVQPSLVFLVLVHMPNSKGLRSFHILGQATLPLQSHQSKRKIDRLRMEGYTPDAPGVWFSFKLTGSLPDAYQTFGTEDLMLPTTNTIIQDYERCNGGAPPTTPSASMARYLMYQLNGETLPGYMLYDDVEELKVSDAYLANALYISLIQLVGYFPEQQVNNKLPLLAEHYQKVQLIVNVVQLFTNACRYSTDVAKGTDDNWMYGNVGSPESDSTHLHRVEESICPSLTFCQDCEDLAKNQRSVWKALEPWLKANHPNMHQVMMDLEPSVSLVVVREKGGDSHMTTVVRSKKGLIQPFILDSILPSLCRPFGSWSSTHEAIEDNEVDATCLRSGITTSFRCTKTERVFSQGKKKVGKYIVVREFFCPPREVNRRLTHSRTPFEHHGRNYGLRVRDIPAKGDILFTHGSTEEPETYRRWREWLWFRPPSHTLRRPDGETVELLHSMGATGKNIFNFFVDHSKVHEIDTFVNLMRERMDKKTNLRDNVFNMSVSYTVTGVVAMKLRVAKGWKYLSGKRSKDLSTILVQVYYD